MIIKISISTDKTNAPSFEDGASIKVADLLRNLADKLEGHPHFSPGLSMPLSDGESDWAECGYFDICDK